MSDAKPTPRALRAALEDVLGSGRLDGVTADKPLLRDGVITSIELVMVVVGLEEAFGVTIRDGDLTAENLTLATLLRVVGGEQAYAPGRREPTLGLARYLRRPVWIIVVALLFLALIDRGVALLVKTALSPAYQEFLEQGQRFYPVSGRFSHDDFEFAVRQHRVSRPDASTPTSVLFFGDSGTIGSYLPAEQSIPAYAERRLPGVRVHNVAWFGRLLVKDLMLLEAMWNESFDIVIFTVGDDYFSKNRVSTWIGRYRHCSVNQPLFADFIENVPEPEREPFVRMNDRLVEADGKHNGARRRWAFKNIALMRYRPFLRYLVQDIMAPDTVFSGTRWHESRTRNRRFYKGKTPKTLYSGLLQDQIDPDQREILVSVIDLLRARGVQTVLIVEPIGPGDWPRETVTKRVTAAQIAAEISEETGAVIVDLSWELDADEFMDSNAHYIATANERLGARVAEAIQEALRRP